MLSHNRGNNGTTFANTLHIRVEQRMLFKQFFGNLVEKFTVIRNNYSNARAALSEFGVDKVDGIVTYWISRRSVTGKWGGQ